MPPHANWPTYGGQLSPADQMDLNHDTRSMYLPVPATPVSLQRVRLQEKKPALRQPDPKEGEPVRWSIGCSIFLIVFIIALAVITVPQVRERTMVPIYPAPTVTNVAQVVPTATPTRVPRSTPTPNAGPGFVAVPTATPVVDNSTDDSSTTSAPPTSAPTSVSVPTPTSAPTPTPTPPPTPTPTPPPTPKPTPTPTPPPFVCYVSYVVQTQWPGGFTVNMGILNTGPATINGWALKFTFPGNQQIVQIWNGDLSESGENITITNASYNRTIPVGSRITLGFNGTWSDNNSSPTAFMLNGVSCSVV